MSALDGIKVIDLSRYLSGPSATMLLADLGADVIKVEALPIGDPSRQSGPFDRGESVYYLASNRNKRSIALDMRSEAGRGVLRRLVAAADVLVENFKPGTIEAMGLGAEHLLARYPRLIHCSISGFGQTGTGGTLPGFDQTAQAMSGLMSVTGTDETGPLRVGIAVGDSVAGLTAAFGIVAKLLDRERTGLGGTVQTSLMESLVTLLSYQAQKYLSLRIVAGRDGNDHPIMFPQGTFQAGQGSLTIACGNERMWRILAHAIGLGDVAEDERYATNATRMTHRRELRQLIERALAARPAEQWISVLNDAGVPAGPVLDIGQALEHPLATELHLREQVTHPTLGVMEVLGLPVKIAGTSPQWLGAAAPLLGQHSIEVLRELDYGVAEIELMIEDGVIASQASERATTSGAHPDESPR